MTTKTVNGVGGVNEAEILEMQRVRLASEQAFRRRKTFEASFHRKDGEVWFRGFWPAMPGCPESSIDRPATDHDREAYPAEYGEFVEANEARK